MSTMDTWTLKQASNGKFNFEEFIDWFIWEQPSLVEERCTEPSAMDAELKMAADISKITVLLPRHRYGDAEGYTYTLEMTTPITPRKLVNEIHSFYQEAISLGEIHTDDDYSKDAKKRLCNGEIVKRVELLGTEFHGSPGAFVSEGLHRHPFLCNGLVRFEGLSAVQKTKTTFKIDLGS